MADERESVIPIASDADVVTARQRARAMASRLELSSTDQTLLATAISEVARNITAYAIRGEVLLSVIEDDGGRRGIRVIARDDGPGIENVELALQDGYTSGTAGSGSGCRARAGSCVDFEIETAPGQGTKVTLVMWERESARAA